MAVNRKLLKFLFTFIVFTQLLFAHPQNSFSKIYEWKDYSKIFKEKTDLMCRLNPTHVKVDLPERLKNYDNITLVVLIETDPTRIHNRHYLIVNNYDKEKYFVNTNGYYRVKISPKHLKAGINSLVFTASMDWCSYGSLLSELRFDLPGYEEEKADIRKEQSPAQASTSKSISSAQEPPKDTIPPKIIITSHDTSRGIRPVKNLKKVSISGRATDENGIVEITVNNKDIPFDERGNFVTDIYLKVGKNKIVVNAMDIYENRARKEFIITRVASKTLSKERPVKAAALNYYALVIGNNNYKYLKKLETAKNDAIKVAEILKLRYGFDTKLLLDADRGAILDAVNDFRRILNQDDQFLIYYAGHGSFDKIAGKAYWLPVDAQRNNDKNWIIVDTITSNIKRISSNHILVVADSCYSGTFTRASSSAKLESAEKRRIYLKKMQAKKSRTLLASGGNEPVSDIGGEGNSVFAKAFLAGLTHIDLDEFNTEELYIQYIKEMVSGSSEQTPEYNIIRNSGHEGGDFVFRRKN